MISSLALEALWMPTEAFTVSYSSLGCLIKLNRTE